MVRPEDHREYLPVVQNAPPDSQREVTLEGLPCVEIFKMESRR